MGSLYGTLGDKQASCGTIVLKRKQGLSSTKAAACPGEVVDLPPQKLESYALSLFLKKIRCSTDKRCYLAADGDKKVDKIIKDCKWDGDDLVRCNRDDDEIGDSVYTDENYPIRLFDPSHEIKNLPRKIHKVG